MAHTCPRCEAYCTCHGDWDDIDMGYDPNCTKDHNGCTEPDFGDEDEEDWDEDDFEYDV